VRPIAAQDQLECQRGRRTQELAQRRRVADVDPGVFEDRPGDPGDVVARERGPGCEQRRHLDGHVEQHRHQEGALTASQRGAGDQRLVLRLVPAGERLPGKQQ
jgi:hypothetical protein